MSNTAISYTIETEVPPSYLGNLLNFIYQKYLLPQKQRFADVSRTILNGDPSLTFTVLDPTGKKSLNVEIRVARAIVTGMTTHGAWDAPRRKTTKTPAKVTARQNEIAKWRRKKSI